MITDPATISILIVSGFFISVFAVVFGGSMFFSVPIFQFLFPEATIGALVGSIKVGSCTRGFVSSLRTFRHINRQAWSLYLSLFLGGVCGALSISELSQNYLLPVIILGIFVTVKSQSIANAIGNGRYSGPTKQVLAFSVGVYGGFFGAGIAILLLALIRILEPEKYGRDDQIAKLKIQARFLEFLLALVAISGHISSGNISFNNIGMWAYWAIGCAAGGLLGASLLVGLNHVRPDLQRAVLYASFALALFTAAASQFGLI